MAEMDQLMCSSISHQYPEGHLEAMEAKEQEKNAAGGSKRKSVIEMLQKADKSPTAKKAKTAGYQLEPDIAQLIENDQLNAKLWEECKESLGDTKQVHFPFLMQTRFVIFQINLLFYATEIHIQSGRKILVHLLPGCCVQASDHRLQAQPLPHLPSEILPGGCVYVSVLPSRAGQKLEDGAQC